MAQHMQDHSQPQNRMGRRARLAKGQSMKELIAICIVAALAAYVMGKDWTRPEDEQ